VLVEQRNPTHKTIDGFSAEVWNSTGRAESQSFIPRRGGDQLIRDGAI
jgi:hypothetical protein